MDYRLTTLEKAFQLARSGDCPSLGYLLKKLKDEGYDTYQVEGKALRKQLRELIERHAERKFQHCTELNSPISIESADTGI